jgi:hypothetical protein
MCQRQATTGYLCTADLDRLAQQLLDIQSQAEMLSAVPSMQAATGSRGGTLASHRSPARLDVLVLTDPRTSADEQGTLGVLAVLASWARAVREDRQLAWPGRVTVASERKTLSAHLEWLASQPFVDEFAAEIHALLRQLQRANGTGGDRPFARCVVPYPEGLCGGDIWVEHVTQTVWRTRPDRCDATVMQVPDGPATCHTCGARWETDADKARLNAMIRDTHDAFSRPHTDDGRPMLTIGELADHLGVTTNAAYIRLHRAGIRADRGHYDPDALTLPGRVAS